MNTGTAPAFESNEHTHINGLSKLGKISPFIIVFISMTTAGIGSYFAARQDTLVVEARLELEISQQKSEIAELKVSVNQVLREVVPRTEHNAVAERDKIIDNLKEELAKTRQELLQIQINKLSK